MRGPPDPAQSGPQRRTRGTGVAEQQVVEELPPGDLAPERRRAGAERRGQADLPRDLPRGAHPQAQVGGEARRRVRRGRVARLRVALEGPRANEAAQGLPRGGGTGGTQGRPTREEVRPGGAEAGSGQALRRRSRRRDRAARPGPHEGREDEIAVAPGARQVLRLDHEVAGHRLRPDTCRRERPADPLVPGAAERGHLTGVQDEVRPCLGGECGKHMLRAPPPDHKRRAEPAQLAVEGLQAGAQEPQALGRGVMATAEYGGVEHEAGDDRAAARGLVQRRVVGDAQVAPVPHDRHRSRVAHPAQCRDARPRPGPRAEPR